MRRLQCGWRRLFWNYENSVVLSGAIDRSLDEIIENWNLKQFKLLQLEDMGE